MTNTPAYRQEWILEELKKEPLFSYGDMFSKYSVKFSKSEKTFSKDWNKAQEQHQAYQKKANEEKERVSIEIEKEAVKQGLKTKIDRVLILQKQVEDCEKELHENECLEIKLIGGKPMKYSRPLLPTEKTALRRTIKELQSEISKIEGDYAKEEIELSTKGSINIADWLKLNNQNQEAEE